MLACSAPELVASEIQLWVSYGEQCLELLDQNTAAAKDVAVVAPANILWFRLQGF
jgi:hypothetical protein